MSPKLINHDSTHSLSVFPSFFSLRSTDRKFSTEMDHGRNYSSGLARPPIASGSGINRHSGVRGASGDGSEYDLETGSSTPNKSKTAAKDRGGASDFVKKLSRYVLRSLATSPCFKHNSELNL